MVEDKEFAAKVKAHQEMVKAKREAAIVAIGAELVRQGHTFKRHEFMDYPENDQPVKILGEINDVDGVGFLVKVRGQLHKKVYGPLACTGKIYIAFHSCSPVGMLRTAVYQERKAGFDFEAIVGEIVKVITPEIPHARAQAEEREKEKQVLQEISDLRMNHVSSPYGRVDIQRGWPGVRITVFVDKIEAAKEVLQLLQKGVDVH
jgi:hypothetical protein